MQTIGGITQTARGWKKFQFKPTFFGSHGGSVIPSPLGNIKSSWSRLGEEIKISLRWPKNVEVKIVLPGQPPQTVDSGKWETRLTLDGNVPIPK
jgi:hypothetical protein